MKSSKKNYYSGYGIEMILGENGFYIPNKDMEIEWYEDLKCNVLFPINSKKMDLEKFIPFLKKMESYSIPLMNSEPEIDMNND